MGLFRKYIAEMWDTNGQHIKNVSFKKSDKKFKFRNGAYNIKLNDGSYSDRKGLLLDKRFYKYNVTYPDPLQMCNIFENQQGRVSVKINPEDYNTLLETSQLKKINQADRMSLNDLLDPKYLIIAGAVIGGIYLILTGGITP